MNTKDLYRKIRRGAGAAALLLATLLTGACNDDDTSTGSPYFRLENVVVSSKMVTSSSELGFDVEAMVGDPTLELIRYDIRSNCDWTVEANSTDADWLLIWPDHGSGDGKVRFCVTDNDNPDPRATTASSAMPTAVRPRQRWPSSRPPTCPISPSRSTTR